MSDIRPIDLPTGAGLSFGKGDVRHFSESDAVDVVGLQNPTRHLAERDNLLASKVNELVAEANNKEQFVPLSVPRTSIAPGTEEVVTNFAIPAGFEARVLNATIGSTPVSSDILLKIYFSTGYGNVTGTELVSTTSTFLSGIAFYNQGEFIVALRNNGSTSLEVAASITLTVRPIGSTASLLVGSVIQGERGLTGGRGDRGLKGDPGTGGAGSPGMKWMGAFSPGTPYSPPHAVSYTAGGITQSYICVLNNPSSQPPTDDTYWDLIASAGSTGGAGINWLGLWDSAIAYAVNDAVSYSVGVTSSYICTASVGPSVTYPGADPAHWDILSGPSVSGAVTSSFNTVSGTVVYDSGYLAGIPDGDYVALGEPSTQQRAAFYEAYIANSATSPFGIAFLRYQQRSVFSGTQTLWLPNATNDAAVNWASTDVVCELVLHGTAASASADVVKITAMAMGTIVFALNNSVPVKASLDVTGFKQIV